MPRRAIFKDMSRRKKLAGITAVFLIALCGVPATEAAMRAFTLTSPAFTAGGPIPAKYTCDGADVSPPLVITGVPAGAQSLALIVEDPDAPRGTWVHWVVWNIAPGAAELAEDAVPVGASLGKTDFGDAAYGGPCPPSGTHRYFFKLYALDAVLSLAPRASKTSLERAMQSHVVGRAELMGTYTRR